MKKETWLGSALLVVVLLSSFVSAVVIKGITFGWKLLSTATGLTDSDDDGMLDWWEQQAFGCASCGDPHGDADNDGYFNIEEYLNHFYGVTS